MKYSLADCGAQYWSDERLSIRQMVREDIPQALSLINAEGWGYSSHDIERMLRMDPDGSFVYGGRWPTALVTCVTYGRTGIIGHLVVSHSARGKKIGRAMVERAIDYFDDQETDSILLYATEEGVRLYEKFGFRTVMLTQCAYVDSAEAAASRAGSLCERIVPGDHEEIIAIDREVFGDDRGKLMRLLLSEYPQHSFKLEREGKIIGFALGRSAPPSCDIGPWVCLSGDSADAASLLHATSSSFAEGTVFLGVLAGNALSLEILEGLKKVKTFQTMLMTRGENRYATHIEDVFGVTALELG